MNIKCSAIGCTNRKKRKDGFVNEVPFHRFPEDPKRRESWIQGKDGRIQEISENSDIISSRLTIH